MFTRISRAILAAALFTIPIYASDQPFATDPKELLSAAESVPAGESAVVVLLDEHRYTFDDAGHATRAEHLIYRVVDQSAVDNWSTVEAEWAPWYEDKPVIAARVISKIGTVSNLDAKAVTEAPARDESLDIFSDNRIFRAPLPAVAAGSVVEQLVTWQDHNPLFDTGTSGRMHFGRYAPVQQTRLVIDAPSSLAIRIVNKTAPLLAPKKDVKDGRQQIVFETGRLEALEDLEWNLPYDESPIPFIAFSTGKSWQDLARRYSEIVEKQIASGSVQAFAKDSIGASTDPKEIVTKALAAIEKNVRYAGVEVGEGSIVPRAPSQVISLKYGDCKDKATLLVAMLRAAGLSANVGLLRAGMGLDVHADLPSLSGFNHVIVRVEGDHPMWVDPTDEFSSAGTLSTQDQDRLVLIASPATTALVRTPAAESTANKTVETRIFKLSDEGKAEVIEITEPSGADDATQRRFAAETDRKQYRESMERYAKEEYSAAKLKNVETTDPRDLSKAFKLTLTVSDAARGTTADIDAAVAIFPQHLLNMLPYSLRNAPADDKDETTKKPKKRVHDFVFTTPYVKEWHYRVEPPPGFAARTLPPNETKQIGTMLLTTSYASEPDGAITATLRFDSGKRRITAAEYEDTRKAASAMIKNPTVFLGLDSIGWAKLTAGDIGAALSEFRRLAELHPKEARHHVQIARAYLGGGMGEAARAEIKRAIAMEPDYAPAQRVLGVILQHDLLGREYRKGFDLPGAIAAYKKAKELKPKDDDIRGEYAKLLERGDDGELFGKGAHLDVAIAEYTALINDLKEDRFESELVQAMAHARKFADLKTRSHDIKDANQRMLAMVIATAATDGVEAALREAKSADQNARRQILGTATQTLMQLRYYPQAAELLEQSVQGTANASQVRGVIEILRHTQRVEEMKLPPNEPKTLVFSLMTSTLEPSFNEDEFTKYLASFIADFEASAKAKRKAVMKEERDKPNKLEASRLKASEGELPSNVLIDIGMASLDMLQEGSEATGYRIRVRTKPGLPNSAPQETYFVVRDKGHYAIASMKSTPAAIGVAALHFLEKNDLETARIWLNWAREDIAAGGGDDPLLGPPFAQFWAKSKPTATADEIRIAASTLVAMDADYAAAAIPLLSEVRAKVKEEQRPWIDVALAISYSSLDDTANFLASAQRAFAVHSDSGAAFSAVAAALIETGNQAEVQKLAKTRLDKFPKDDLALRALADLAAKSGDFETSSKYLRKIIDESTASSSDYNNVAWNELFIGKSIDRAIEDARQATNSPDGGAASLHTLAALYAESGKSLEARTELLKSMDEAGRDDPSSVDWYVLGRIAENFGAAEAAIADYKRVDKPEKLTPASTYQLAQKRLTVLTKNRS
jgi:tetratricopeptide (TPR) repeat protein